MSNLIFISDTHFFHRKIREYENRPEDCDGIMMQELYRAVGPEDTLVHVGDVQLYLKPRHARYFVNALPGKEKILIEGNHDKSSRIRTSPHWDQVTRYGEVWEFEKDGLRVAVSHSPEALKECTGNIHIHGHVHSNLPRFRWKHGRLVVNACVEVWDYKPFSWEDIVSELEKYRKHEAKNH